MPDHNPASADDLPSADPSPAPEASRPPDWLGQVMQHASRLGWAWVPVRSLSPRQRERIAVHLLALDERDRYLRFGALASDAQIRRYVDTLDFSRDEVFGIFNRRLVLLAMAHLAYESPPPGTPGGRPTSAEFGVSVLAAARRRGYGARLFDHAMLHARNRGVRHLHVHALSENAAMIAIARHAGAEVERLGSESEAVLTLPPDTVASRIEQAVGSHAAQVDFELKRQAAILSDVLDSVSEIRQRHSDVGQVARE
jgi:RimJ/RimL family protein N-acetyltransferase